MALLRMTHWVEASSTSAPSTATGPVAVTLVTSGGTMPFADDEYIATGSNGSDNVPDLQVETKRCPLASAATEQG